MVVKTKPLRHLEGLVNDGLSRLHDERPGRALEAVTVGDVDAFVDDALQLKGILTDKHVGEEPRDVKPKTKRGMTDVQIAVLPWIAPDDPTRMTLTNPEGGAFGVRSQPQCTCVQ